jgi:hypothetical protein
MPIAFVPVKANPPVAVAPLALVVVPLALVVVPLAFVPVPVLALVPRTWTPGDGG